MAVSSYNAIGSFTLSSAQTQVTFSNIPQIYTDLVVVCSLVATSATLQNAPQLRINGDSRNNYSATALNGNGTNAASGRWSNQSVIYADYYGILQNDSIGMMTAHYMNYTSNTSYKTVLIRSGKGNKETTATIGLWRNTAAINSIQLITDSPNTFAAGTTFNLYGVGANTLKASGGDIIVSDGTYWYHAFKTSGTFTPNSTLSCDVVVVAGGGAGGHDQGGGGGAGGYRSTTGLSISSATTVTIGAGGAPTGSFNVKGNGSNSVFSSITATGGGGAGGYNQNGNSGGSGAGGGGGNTGTGGTGGTGNSGNYSPVEGYAGGDGSSGATAYTAGGGGGATAAGTAGTGTTSGIAGNGGGGSNGVSSWLSVVNLGVGGVLAGGGGGGCYQAVSQIPGAGGEGGGGNGGGGIPSKAGANGVFNTGSGGGGGSGNGGAGGAGGSGLVIVRYPV